jgi:SET domain-containing protein
MEVKDSKTIDGLGLIATKQYKKGTVIFVLKGEETNYPTRESIYVGNNTHVLDQMGQYINHSFEPTVQIQGYNVVALIDINENDEITFNYNDNELTMAAPFTVNGQSVSGKMCKIR